ncbi:winged helix-turn-helix transcriptional regulator [Culicoidibacter larvae]|uniref:Helix-turn-helix transcriptional regulator n=1 Tax=Culicoidibacter larvae TaxID=2579976 RepID=A0A5R8QI70_9FIRM|nr:helix-turn-helix domain-containing protein [Culicoidibacter larvae]TLG77123.1 helix-turn-helix transcriptional regulator [Culicoidibacter larvae]
MQTEICPVQTTVQLISGKWKPVIIYHLLYGKLRFGELQKKISGITQRSLTLQLRELEDDGMISRTIYPEIPPKVEYELTETGMSMKDIIHAMCDWGQTYQQTHK